MKKPSIASVWIKIGQSREKYILTFSYYVILMDEIMTRWYLSGVCTSFHSATLIEKSLFVEKIRICDKKTTSFWRKNRFFLRQKKIIFAPKNSRFFLSQKNSLLWQKKRQFFDPKIFFFFFRKKTIIFLAQMKYFYVAKKDNTSFSLCHKKYFICSKKLFFFLPQKNFILSQKKIIGRRIFLPE